MPIDYSEYHPKWSLISRLIRFRRAKNRCETCGLVNGSIIDKKDRRNPSPDQWMMFNDMVKFKGWAIAMKRMKFTKIVLTVAHLDHDKANNRFSNLKALCQKCHLDYDLKHHIQNRKYGRKYKENQTDLFK